MAHNDGTEAVALRMGPDQLRDYWLRWLQRLALFKRMANFKQKGGA